VRNCDAQLLDAQAEIRSGSSQRKGIKEADFLLSDKHQEFNK
jgi:hypothetical protein